MSVINININFRSYSSDNKRMILVSVNVKEPLPLQWEIWLCEICMAAFSILFRSTATVVANRNTSLIQIHKSGQDVYRPQQYLRKGNVFTGVCLSVHHPGADTPLGRYLPPRQTLPLSSRQALQRTVRILLECIFVEFYSQEGHLFV